MVDEVMPKPLQDLAAAFLMTMVADGILFGWLHNRGRPHRGEDGSGDGSSTDDVPHHHGWWGNGDGDGGHQGDAGDSGH